MVEQEAMEGASIAFKAYSYTLVVVSSSQYLCQTLLAVDND